MKALYIAGAVVLLQVLLSTLRVKIFFRWRGKAVSLKIKVLCFSSEKEISGAEMQKEAAEKTRRRQAKPAEKKTPAEIKEALAIILGGVKKLLRKFKKYVRLEKYTLKIDLGTEDPAKTALLYGALFAPVAALHTLASSVKRRSHKADAVCTEFTPDFYADRTNALAEIGFSLRIWQIAACLFAARGAFLKYRRHGKKTEKDAKGGNENERILA